MKQAGKLFLILSVLQSLILTSCVSKNERFAKTADDYLIKSGFSGSVMVVKKGKIIFSGGYGSSDIKNPEALPNDLNTVYETGSLSKQLVAAAILKLVEKRKLNLDDNIYQFFPDFKHGKKITIRMLLNMRSGLTDHINCAHDFFPKSIHSVIAGNQLSNKHVDYNFVQVYLPSAPIIAEPDATYFYCNTNYYLLAKIIEQISGKTYEDFMTKKILSRCGMENSNFDFQNTSAKGYVGGRYYSIPAGLAFGCGDLNSSVMDLYKWNCAFLGGKIVSKKYIRELKHANGYHYGWNCGNKMIFHAGNTNVFNSYNSYNFKTKTQIIVLCNTPVGKCNATKIAGVLNKFL